MNLMEPMSLEQQHRIRDAARAAGLYAYALISLGLCHALRASEYGQIKVADVNFRDNTITIRRLKKSLTTTEMLMPAEVPILREWIATKPANEMLFPCANRKFVYRLVHDCAQKAGLPASVSGPHALKHTLLQRLCDAGFSLPQLMRAGGHKTASASLRYYQARQSQVDDLKMKVFAA